MISSRSLQFHFLTRDTIAVSLAVWWMQMKQGDSWKFKVSVECAGFEYFNQFDWRSLKDVVLQGCSASIRHLHAVLCFFFFLFSEFSQVPTSLVFEEKGKFYSKKKHTSCWGEETGKYLVDQNLLRYSNELERRRRLRERAEHLKAELTSIESSTQAARIT